MIIENTINLIESAMRGGLAEGRRRLIPSSRPTTFDSSALQIAAWTNDHKMVDVLWNVSNPKAALAAMHKSFANMPNAWRGLAQRIAAEEQRQVLGRAAVPHECSKKMHKI